MADRAVSTEAVTPTSTVGVHIATVRQFDPASGVATVVVPALYGDTPIEARPFLPSRAQVSSLPVLNPGDTVLAFYDGGNPMTILRWYLTGGGAGGAGTDEVWIGTTPPTDPAIELWYDPEAVPPVPPGPGPGGSYLHNQDVPSDTWVIVHNLGFFPSVRIEDTAGDDIEGDLTHDSANQTTATFSAAIAGKAYCS
jgi:hypothetical protein